MSLRQNERQRQAGSSVFLIALLALQLGCGKSSPPAQPSTEAPAKIADASMSATQPGSVVIPPDSPQLKRIRLTTVESAIVPVGEVSAPAKVEADANRLSHVMLPVTGHVVAVNAKIGDAVRQGQSLVVVESPEAEAANSSYLQAQAAITTAQSGVTSAKSALAKAQADLDREKDLFEHGAVPQKEVLSAQAILVQSQAAVDQAGASVEQAFAAAEQAKRRLQLLGLKPGGFGQRVTVNSPIAGKVLELSVANGEFRNDLSAPMMTVADLSSVWVTSDVPETSIRLVRKGEPIQIELDAYPGVHLTGRVLRIGDTVDPQSRTVKVHAELPNPDERLKPEMFGTVKLVEQAEPKPVVPTVCVVAQNGETYVWRSLGPGRFERTKVTTGAQVGDRIAILSGLKVGDSVVSDGVMLLRAN